MPRFNLAHSKGLRPDQIETVWLLAGLGKTPYQIAQQLDVGEKSIREYLRTVTSTPHNVKKNLAAVRANRSRAYAEHFKTKAVEIAETITPATIQDMSGSQKAMILNVLVDKAKVFDDMACKLEEKWDQAEGGKDYTPHRPLAEILQSVTDKATRLTMLQIDLPGGLQAKLDKARLLVEGSLEGEVNEVSSLQESDEGTDVQNLGERELD